MKKIFTIIGAVLLTLEVSAQTTLGEMKRGSAPQRKIQIDEGERLMGYYTSDELYYILAFSTTGVYYVADCFSDDVIGNLVGGDIVRFRFGLGVDTYVYNAFILSRKQDTMEETLLSSVDINATLSEGWNDVELPSSVTLESGYDYLIGYAFEQVTSNVLTSAGYSMCVDNGLDTDIECECFYYSYGEIGKWGAVSGRGGLCIQAVVKGGTFLDYDLALSNLAADDYVRWDQDLSYSFKIRNDGEKTPTSYSLNVAIDGTVVETIDTPISLTDSYQTVSRTLSLDGYPAGDYTLSVSVDKINGTTPTEGTQNDRVETTFSFAGSDMPERQMHLVENFTAVGCTYCPRGHKVIEYLQDNNPGKYAWAAIHYNFNGTDPYYVDESVENILNFSGYVGYPSAAVSRALLTSSWLGIYNQMAFTIGYTSYYTAAVYIDQAVEDAYDGVPAYVSVNIIPQYNADTRELTIIVDGKGSSDARTVLADNLLTVYITEDGLVGSQLNSGTWDYNYTHNNVLRAIPSTYAWGDEINWTSDTSYRNTITMKVDSSWNINNLNIIAFVSGPMKVLNNNGSWIDGDKTTARVNNCYMVKATDEVYDGISAATVSPENDAPRSYYTIDGRQLSAPTKGVNIVRYADGTSKKLLVK